MILTMAMVLTVIPQVAVSAAITEFSANKSNYLLGDWVTANVRVANSVRSWQIFWVKGGEITTERATMNTAVSVWETTFDVGKITSAEQDGIAIFAYTEQFNAFTMPTDHTTGNPTVERVNFTVAPPLSDGNQFVYFRGRGRLGLHGGTDLNAGTREMLMSILGTDSFSGLLPDTMNGEFIQEVAEILIDNTNFGHIGGTPIPITHTFELSRPGRVSLTVRHPGISDRGMQLIANLRFHNDNVDLVQVVANGTDEVATSVDRNAGNIALSSSPASYSLPAGKYDLHITGGSGGWFVREEFTVEVNLIECIPELRQFEIEGNHTAQRANGIMTNSPVTGRLFNRWDRDYFRFMLTEPRQVRLDFNHPQFETPNQEHSTIAPRWRVTLFNGNEETLTTFDSRPIQARATSEILTLLPGVYYVSVRGEGQDVTPTLASPSYHAFPLYDHTFRLNSQYTLNVLTNSIDNADAFCDGCGKFAEVCECDVSPRNCGDCGRLHGLCICADVSDNCVYCGRFAEHCRCAELCEDCGRLPDKCSCAAVVPTCEECESHECPPLPTECTFDCECDCPPLPTKCTFDCPPLPTECTFDCECDCTLKALATDGKPSIQDALQILRFLVGLPNVINNTLQR
jgi:hypothetical protein